MSAYLSEQHRELMKSLGLEVKIVGAVVVVSHEDQTETRLDADNVRTWLDGYLAGRISGLDTMKKTLRGLRKEATAANQ